MLLLDDINLLTLLVGPIKCIDVAGNDGQNNRDSARRSLCPRSSIGVVCQAGIPVQPIDSTGNDG